MPLDTRHVKGIIWDLDNTLYHFTDKFFKSCTEAAAKAAQEAGINISYEHSLKIAERSEREHGYSMHIYITHHGLSYADLHFPYHRGVDENAIEIINGTQIALNKFKGKQVILTNASRCWAKRALKFIGIEDLFFENMIIPMEDVNFLPKASSEKGFELAAEKLNLPYENILMVDDLDRNLIIPHKLGMQTVFMHHGDPIPLKPYFIDDQYDNLVTLMKEF